MPHLETKPAAVKVARSEADLQRLFPVMKVLRPHLASAEEFVERVRRQEANSGWRLIYIEEDGQPVGCAGFRVSEWLAWGRALYVDDLVVLESHRGRGFADALMLWMQDCAIAEGCTQFHLDSGTHRLPAHRFYHRLKMGVTSFHFQKELGPGAVE